MTTTILHLGGARTRILATALRASLHERERVIISSEADPAWVIGVLRGAGIALTRCTFDYTAADTLENFTATRAQVLALGTTDLVVVTHQHPDPDNSARDHMDRAFRIFQWVYRGTGVVFRSEGDPTPLSPEEQRAETWWTHTRDVVRAAVWYFTGWVIPQLGTGRIRALNRERAREAARILGHRVRGDA